MHVHAVTIPADAFPAIVGEPCGDSAMSISVVVPVHNEAPTVRTLYGELCAALDRVGQPWEAIFVDDGSTDGSYAELARLHEGVENVRVVRLRRNFGKAAALTAGFLKASGHTIVTLDADLQDDPAEIPRLLARLDDGFDVVSGWKVDRCDPLSRRLLSKVFNRTVRLLSGVRIHDVNCGLKAYRAQVTRDVRIYGERHRFLPVLAHSRGYSVGELPVNHRPRAHGRSRYGLERYLRAFLDLLAVSFIERYRQRPLHLFGNLGLLLSTVGAGLLAYLTALKIGGAGIGERPLLLLGVLFVVVGIQLLSLGLIGEMLTSQHETRTTSAERLRFYVRDVLD
jgi:glycosyltransferase involved in cell wall biosynthesis